MTAVRTTTDLVYGPDPAHHLDLYEPPAPAQAAIVDIHGGGWWTGDKSSETRLASALAAAGYLVVAPDYRLADGASRRNLYPTQVEDISLALTWLRESNLAFDRSRIGVVGTSSGGNLAVETGLRHGVPAASWSGLLDLDGFLWDHPGVVPKRIDPAELNSPAGVDQGGANDSYYAWLVGNLLGGELTHAAAATPIHRVTASSGPMFLANSLAELVPAKEVSLMMSALIRAGIPAEAMVLPGSRHAEAYLPDALPATMAFFTRYLRGEALVSPR
jgi:acetyl esterase/lipase